MSNLQTNHLFGSQQGSVTGCGSCNSMSGGKKTMKKWKKSKGKSRRGGCLTCGCTSSKPKPKRKKGKKGKKSKKGGGRTRKLKKKRKTKDCYRPYN